MAEQLTIAEQGRAALTRSLAEANTVAREWVRRPNAPNTNRAYEQARKAWTAHCDALGVPWGPIDAEHLISYLTMLSATHKPNSVRLHLAALADIDKACRVTATDPSPVSIRFHWAVKRWYRGWARAQKNVPKKRAAALGVSALERMLHAAAERPKNAAARAHVVRYARDRCLLLIGSSGAFRAGELGALTFGQVEATERGLSITVQSSKTDQTGEAEPVGLMPQGRAILCPVEAYQQWRTVRGDAPGPLFCAVERTGALDLEGPGLSERQITRLVSDYARRAGLRLQVSAHSLRATLATLAAEKGKSLPRIMAHGRWESAAIAATYVRQGELFNDNVTSGLFD